MQVAEVKGLVLVEEWSKDNGDDRLRSCALAHALKSRMSIRVCQSESRY